MDETPPPAAGGEETGGQEEAKRCPWEEQDRLGFLTAIWQTWRQSLFGPSAFFRWMPVRGGYKSPLGYGMLVGTTELLAALFWQLLITATAILSGAGEALEEYRPFALAVMALLAPLLVFIGLFVGAGILHLCLLLVGGDRQGFEATFRVQAYSAGAHLLNIIPLCGWLVAPVWFLVLQIIGLREAHGISGGRAALAVLLPLIVCCGFVFLLVSLFMAAVGVEGLRQLLELMKETRGIEILLRLERE